MKGLAIFLIVLSLCVIGCIGYFYISCNLIVSDITCVMTDFSEYPEEFSRLKAEIQNDTSSGTVFNNTLSDNPGDYQFFTYTVHLTNNTFLSADLIEVQVVPMSEDILQTEDLTRHRLSAGEKGEISASILTRSGMHSIREMNLSWYFWGLPFHVKYTYNH